MQETFVDPETGWLVTRERVVCSGVELFRESLTDPKTGQIHDLGLRSPSIDRDYGAYVRVRTGQPQRSAHGGFERMGLFEWGPTPVRESEVIDQDDRFTLADGRKVTLQWVRLSQTFLGVWFGSLEMASTIFRKDLQKKAELRGWQIVDPHGQVLPQYQCVASLISYSPVRKLDYSTLDVCWFVDTMELNVRVAVANILTIIDWNNRAIDGSWDEL